jgi:uncharacterized protein (TIGR03435 family)
MSVSLGVLAGLLVVSACHAQTPARLEFEAASVKPSLPFGGSAITMGCRGGPGTSDPGLFRCENFSLSNLINWGHGLGPNQLSAPDWMGQALFDITARVPPGTTPEQFQAMLRTLLTDRFKLAIHHETREARGYRLVVAKDGPRFKPAAKQQTDAIDEAPQRPPAPKPLRFDEAGYPLFGPGDSGTTSTFDGRTRMHEPSTTMHRLAIMLSSYLHATVTDATGLTGEYEISLYWILDSALAAGSAEDASGPTLVEALQKQLGLRLEKTANATKDVLVVDYAEKVPTEN